MGGVIFHSALLETALHVDDAMTSSLAGLDYNMDAHMLQEYCKNVCMDTRKSWELICLIGDSRKVCTRKQSGVVWACVRITRGLMTIKLTRVWQWITDTRTEISECAFLNDHF
jgi:hypothetical protein